MSQNSLVVANGSGAAVRSALNNALNSLVTINSGAAAPSTTYAYMLWADTTNDLLKIRNAANSAWITVGTLSQTNLGLTPIPRMGIAGLTYGNNGSDAVNDIDIAAGETRDATNAHNIVLSAITKQSDVAWAVGTAAGGLDTGAVGNSDYYIWAIKRSDTGVCDVLFSLSSTAPTMPTNYNFKRLIGWFKRVGGTIVAFHTYELPGGGLDYAWDSPTLDINLAATLTTSRRTDTLAVPQGFSVLSHINVGVSDANAGQVVYLTCPDTTDIAPSATAAPLATLRTQVAGNNEHQDRWVRTSATGTIAARADIATIDVYRVVTLGFQWGRRN